MANDGGAFESASDMLRALRARDVSAVELLDRHLARIERFNPTLNAIVIPDFETARETAAATDAARARGEDAALLGLPLTIKDCIDVRGLRGTAGVPDFAERVPEQDSRVAARVRAAGGVLMGKTNVPPWAGDWQADNPIFGRTNNPWDLDRTPGGSTGGGSAALAAGLTPLEFGSDIGGSIRVPAAFCGLYGHRPSETVVPRSGHFPGVPLPNAAFVMGVQGPLARYAEDIELALDVIAGPDVDEEIGWTLRIPAARHEHLRDFRVAVMPPLEWLPVDAEILEAQEQLTATLRAAGARVEIAQPEGMGDWREYTMLYLTMVWTMTHPGTEEAAREAEVAELRASGDPYRMAMADGLSGRATDALIWYGRREQYRAAYRAFFRDWDVLLAPITLGPAFPHTTAPVNERTLDINGSAVDYMLQVVYAGVVTLAGQPSTAFPLGLNRAGLPIGLQAIGPYLEDRTPIRFTQLVAQEIGGFRAPAGYE